MPQQTARETKTGKMEIRVTPTFLEQIDQTVGDLGTTRSEFIRQAAIKLSEEVQNRHQQA